MTDQIKVSEVSAILRQQLEARLEKRIISRLKKEILRLS